MAADQQQSGPWTFDEYRPPESLEQAVQEAVGGASMCWEHVERAGVFQSDRALEVSSALIAWVEANYTPKVRRFDALDAFIADAEQQARD